MPRPLRNDVPNAYHHVMGRGIAHRALFDSQRDIRFFLALLAHAVHRGWIEVHAYAILTTHFHLLVRSVRGALDRAMQWVLDLYARRFNRVYSRAGRVFLDRYRAKRIDDTYYWTAVLRYIDRNAVAAGLAPRPFDYPYCSAWHYGRDYGPPWLTRTEVERHVARVQQVATYEPGLYARPLPWDNPGAPGQVIES